MRIFWTKMGASESSSHEIVIVGAGAAGLACAVALRRAGRIPLVLEARDRIGGRARSFLHPQGTVIEFGAEFIHGAHHETLDLLEKAGEPFVDLCDRHLFCGKGKRSEIPDFWEQIDRCNSLLNPKLKTDRSIAEFIQARGGSWGADLRKLYISYVEGFQAADLHKAGEKGMARAEKGDEPELNSQAQFRPLQGYGSLMEILRNEAALSAESLHLQTAVREIRSGDEGIELMTENIQDGTVRSYRAKKVVLTLPLGVLKNSLVFRPEIPEMSQALTSLETGHVQRITFQFSDRFWEALSEEPIGFLHAGPEEYFPTWWTQMPVRSPFLTAWQGGPKAEEMSSWSEDQKVERALRTLAVLTGISFKTLKKKYRTHYAHDWTMDPFSQGAYSYVGISKGRSVGLPKSLGDRIYLAGEATRKDSSRGTVHGALASGFEAARRLLST